PQRRHLAGVERALELGRFPLLLRSIDPVALESLLQGLLDRGQDPVAPFGILPFLLVIAQPERRVHAEEHEEDFSHPAADERQEWTMLTDPVHRPAVFRHAPPT